MKRACVLFILFIAVNCFSQTTVSKELENFTELKIYSGIDVELVKSTEQKIVISGERSENVKIKNAKTTLKISFPFFKTPYKSKVKVVVYYNKDIKIIDANEGATITAKDFQQQSVSIKTQEGAYINMLVTVKHLNIKAVSDGIIKLSGTSTNLIVETNSGGAFYGFDLKNENVCSVSASLGGKAEVYTIGTLDAKVNFGGSIFYKGTPEVLKTKKVIAGSIEQKN